MQPTSKPWTPAWAVTGLLVPLLAPQLALAAPALPATPLVPGTAITAANQADYTHELPTGRFVSPVGAVTGAPNFPTKVAVTADGVAVLANGPTKAQTLTFFDPLSLAPISQAVAFPGVPSGAKSAKLESAANIVGAWQGHIPARIGVDKQSLFQGLAQGPGGILYAAGGAADDVLALSTAHGKLAVNHRYSLAGQPFPKAQYPYEYQGEQDKTHLFYPGGLVVGPAGKHLYVTGLLSNSLARIDLATDHVDYRNVGPFPFGVTVADGGARLVVSDWGGNGVTVLDRARFKVVGRIPTGPHEGPTFSGAGVHPTALAAMASGPMVFVADANVDKVVEVNSRTLRPVRVFDDSPYRGAPPGSYPDGLALKGNRLFVANAGNDDVAVFDTRTGRQLGLIPTGWYPTDVAVGKGALYIVSAKGFGAGPNVHHQWVGNMMNGLVQRVMLAQVTRHLPRWTAQALAHDGFGAAQRAHREAANRRATTWLHHHVKYVVFILRENKTFDEELGKYGPAGHWADPHLDLFDSRQLPNLYSWAHKDTLFANFMADGESTAQGHEWTTGTSDSDWVQRTWIEYYSGRKLEPNPGWTQSLVPGGASGWGGIPLGVDNPLAIYQNLSALNHWSNPWISYPGRLYLFNDLLAHHVPFEDFGEFVSRSKAGQISPAMHAHLGVDFPGWDRMILDTYRAKLAISWLKSHPHSFPHFLYIWLPDDHTAGSDPCFYTPDYYAADNDNATAQFVHYLSTTPQWKHMAVFLTEDDAQSGADHIDAHRTFAEALGPWVKQGLLDTERFSQVDIIRTTEAILGLPAMSQWDDNATVFSHIWTDHPDFAPVNVLPMQVKPAINPGSCTKFTQLRRDAGATGHTLGTKWLKQHADKLHGQAPEAVKDAQRYTPTSLLTVAGPEQMRQEWIASKGKRSYQAVSNYLKAYAKAHHAPVKHYIANDDDD